MIRGLIFDFNRTIYNPEEDRLIEGSEKLLRVLKRLGFKLCLLSKRTRENRREQIFQLGLDRYFDKILIIKGDKKEKHFQECLSSMCLSSPEVVVIGDRVESEILIANRLGMLTIWFQRGKFANVLPKNKFQKPDYVITNLEEIIGIIS